MEADKFDQLIANKLGQVNSPEFDENQWALLNAKIPSSGFGFKGIVWWLVSILLLSNAIWAWNFISNSLGKFNEIDSPYSVTVDDACDIDPINQTVSVTVTDTIFNYISVDKIVYVEVAQMRTPLDPMDDFSRNSIKKQSLTTAKNSTSGEILSDYSQNEDVLFDSYQNETISTDRLSLHTDVLLDSIPTREEETVLAQNEDSVEKPKKERDPYEGPNWYAGVNGQVPISIGGDQSAFSAYSIGLNLEYQPASWLCLITELNYGAQKYAISNPDFYTKIVDQSDQGIYGAGGVYGTGYTWQNSEIANSSTQAGAFFKITNPSSQGKMKPFISSGYLLDLTQNTEVMNRLLESGTEKIILVESKFPDNQMQSFLRSEFGIESQLSEQFSIRLSADYWFQLTGTEYTGDMFGMKAVVVYVLK